MLRLVEALLLARGRSCVGGCDGEEAVEASPGTFSSELRPLGARAMRFGWNVWSSVKPSRFSSLSFFAASICACRLAAQSSGAGELDFLLGGIALEHRNRRSR